MADFELSAEQRLVRQAVREFAEKEILPHVERYEREERYPLELIAKLPDPSPELQLTHQRPELERDAVDVEPLRVEEDGGGRRRKP